MALFPATLKQETQKIRSLSLNAWLNRERKKIPNPWEWGGVGKP